MASYGCTPAVFTSAAGAVNRAMLRSALTATMTVEILRCHSCEMSPLAALVASSTSRASRAVSAAPGPWAGGGLAHGRDARLQLLGGLPLHASLSRHAASKNCRKRQSCDERGWAQRGQPLPAGTGVLERTAGMLLRSFGGELGLRASGQTALWLVTSSLSLILRSAAWWRHPGTTPAQPRHVGRRPASEKGAPRL